LPARRVLAVELDRLGEVVERGLFLVGLVALLAHPEEILRHEGGERLTVLFFGCRAELLAERLEARVGDRGRRADRYRLVRLVRRALLLLLLLLLRRTGGATRRRAALAA